MPTTLIGPITYRRMVNAIQVAIGLATLVGMRGGFAGEKAITVERIQPPLNQQAALVKVSVTEPSRIYQIGEFATVHVTSRVGGLLYLLYVHSDDSVNVLFPNGFDIDNRIEKDRTYVFPGENARYRFPISYPTGEGLVKAFVVSKPSRIIDDNLKRGELLELNASELVEFRREMMIAPESKAVGVRPADVGLAEHHVRITTVDKDRFGKGTTRQLAKKKRYVISIGVGRQRNASIPSLPACENDARQFAGTMKDMGADDVRMLLNDQVTMENVSVLFEEVGNIIQPEDEVILFWSGHGAQIADRNGDEKDGFDELLVLYDGDQSTDESKLKTMILDDTLGRWIEGFNGAEVLAILDTCHSGGQATNEKGIGVTDFEPFTKDIHEKAATVFCASRAAQAAQVKLGKDLSVMTDYIIKYLRNNRGNRTTVNELFRHVEREVEQYTLFKLGVRQNPVLIGNPNSRIEFE